MYPTHLILNVASFTYERNIVKTPEGQGELPVQVPFSGKMSVVTLDSTGHGFIFWVMFLLYISILPGGTGRLLSTLAFVFLQTPALSCTSP